MDNVIYNLYENYDVISLMFSPVNSRLGATFIYIEEINELHLCMTIPNGNQHEAIYLLEEHKVKSFDKAYKLAKDFPISTVSAYLDSFNNHPVSSTVH